MTALRQRARWAAPPSAMALSAGATSIAIALLAEASASALAWTAVEVALANGATLAAGIWIRNRADRRPRASFEAKVFFDIFFCAVVTSASAMVTLQFLPSDELTDLELVVVAMLASAPIAVAFAHSVSVRATRAVEALTERVSRLSQGEYSFDVDHSQVRMLADELDLLAERLRSAEDDRALVDQERRELTSSISHDLRTPLSSVRALAEAIADGVLEGGQVREYSLRMSREVERLSRMIDDLFELARIDAGALVLNLRPIDLREVAAESVDAMSVLAARLEVRMVLHMGDEELPALLDGTRTERAISNLVHNALEHSSSGGEIVVSTFRAADEVVVMVEDGGAGIAPEVLPSIWERFYRGDASRRRLPGAGDGGGLGLAIVRGVVEAHHGTVEVASTRGAGARFTLRFPALHLQRSAATAGRRAGG